MLYSSDYFSPVSTRGSCRRVVAETASFTSGQRDHLCGLWSDAEAILWASRIASDKVQENRGRRSECLKKSRKQ